MKRWICLIVCLLLCLQAAALAEEGKPDDIAALMARQVSGNSTLRVQCTAELSEQAPSFIDAADWARIRQAAEGASLEGAYVFSRAGETLGNSTATLTLNRDEQTLSTLYLAGRGGVWQLWGDALGQQVISMPRDTSLLLRDKYLTLYGWSRVLLRSLGSTYAQATPQQEGQWPGLTRFLTEVFTEGTEWNEKMSPYLERYTQQIAGWIQANTNLLLVKAGDGAWSTASEVRLSADALADEALTLLRMFFADLGLTSQLRGKMTTLEANSYLEAGMTMLFEQILREMTLPEDFTLTRGYNAEGDQQQMALRLPLPDGTVLSWVQEAQQDTFGFEHGDTRVSLSVQGDAGTGWQGRFEAADSERRYAGQYQLFAEMQPMYEDEDADGRQRRQNGTATLLITPEEGTMPAQTILAEVTARAGLENDQPAHWNVILRWQESGGASLRLAIKTRTAAASQQLEAPGEPQSLTALEEEAKKALKQQILDHFSALLWPESH